MKRTAVILSVVLVLFFAMAAPADAHCCVCISKLDMKLLSQDIYSWELAKSCDVEGPVELGVDESVDLTYTVSATRSKPQTVRTVELSARVSGVDKVQVKYNKKSYDVDVVNGSISIELPYACGVNKFSVKAGCWTRTCCKWPLKTVKKASLGSTATLGDSFACTPDGLIVEMSDEFAAERTLSSCKINTYQFEYTVTVTNQSSFGQTHTLTNTALLEYGDGGPLEESTSVMLTTPEKLKEPDEQEPDDPDDPGEPDEKEPGTETTVEPEEPKLEPEPEGKSEKKPLPRTFGGGGAMGLIGVLMTAAGLFTRKFK